PPLAKPLRCYTVADGAHREDMRQSPHFRTYGDHVDFCDAAELLDLLSGRSGTRSDEKGRSSSLKSERNPDVFNLVRPASHFAKVEHRRGGLTKAQSKTAKASARKSAKNRRGHSEYYAIKSLVSRFLFHRKNDLVASRMVRIRGETLSYGDLFKGVYHQDVERLPNSNRVYWGPAYFDRTKNDDGYRITFGEYLILDRQNIRPTVLVMDSVLDRYPVKKLISTRIEEIRRQKSPRGFLFALGTPKVRLFKDRSYVNIAIESLDHIDVRYIDLFDELRK
ncbi:hypothetical protein, partial [Oceanococcus atlanticus]